VEKAFLAIEDLTLQIERVILNYLLGFHLRYLVPGDVGEVLCVPYEHLDPCQFNVGTL
jgi:hypothetical protein